MMNSGLSLVLIFLTLAQQSITWVDCCCGAFCSRPGEVCLDCDHQPGRYEKAKSG